MAIWVVGSEGTKGIEGDDGGVVTRLLLVAPVERNEVKRIRLMERVKRETEEMGTRCVPVIRECG